MITRPPRARIWPVAKTFALVASVGINIGLVGYSHLRDDARAAISAQLASRDHQSGPTIVLGDSIIAAANPGQGEAINLAVPGATIDWIAANQVDMVSGLRPSRIVLAAGVNDLRAGASPAETATRLVALAKSLCERLPDAKVILLAVLPPARRVTVAGAASVANVFETNRLLSEQASRHGLMMIDHSLLFARAEGLNDQLTYDGLHLNAAGQSLLGSFLFYGLANGHFEFRN